MLSLSKSPIMAKALAAVVLVATTVIGLMYWQMSAMEAKLLDMKEAMGIQAQYMAQQTQTIKEQEQDKEQLNAQRVASESALASNIKQQKEIQKTNKLLRVEIDRLKYESKETRDYMRTLIPVDVVRLFIGYDSKAGDNCQKRICNAADVSSGANDCATYETESLIWHNLELTEAINQCNSDKESLRQFFEDVEAMNE